MTFHELAGLLARQNGQNVEFQEENIFPKLAQYLVENISLLNNQLDVLVVDEGQDFDKSWGEALISMVKEGGRVVWLEDPSQDLYGRWQTNWPEWVKISSPVNYRSPQRLVSLMNALELTNDHQEVGNGYVGMIPNIEPYQDGMEIEATERAIRDLVAEGYEPNSIAVLSYRGVANSKVLSSNVTELAGLKVKKFTGFNSLGIATWSDGQIFVDTLFRFKGQCADAVILTEVDFEEWSENAKRRLFVGLTRARLSVSLVLTEKASELIDQKLGS
jgi:superfamily I DNA and RNA helicase